MLVSRKIWHVVLAMAFALSASWAGGAQQSVLAAPSEQTLQSLTTENLPFSQDWADGSLIAVGDDWSGVPGVEGYQGLLPTNTEGVDPQTFLAFSDTAPQVYVNQTNPSNPTTTAAGVGEFRGGYDVVALRGSDTADTPQLVISLNTSGHSGITVSYNLRDIDASPRNSIQPFALQYRVGNTGDFINVPAGFVADATTGPDLGVLITPVTAALPAAVDNKPEVQLRILTYNAVGSDEWVGVDDIVVDSVTFIDEIPEVASTIPVNDATLVALDTTITISFSEEVMVGDGWFEVDCGGTVVPASYTGGPVTFVITPEVELPDASTCTVTVFATEVTDMDDPFDEMNEDFILSFDTLDLVPTVVSSVPVEGAVDVADDSDITVTFSEPVSILTADLNLVCDGGDIPLTADSADLGVTYVFSLADAGGTLPLGATCVLTLSAADVVDGADQPLAEDFVLTFTVEGEIVTYFLYMPLVANTP